MKDSLDTDLREIEAQLANLNPTKMPDGMISRMEQVMISWETNLPLEEKILPLKTQEVATSDAYNNASSSKIHIWSAAAAIALLAGVASVFMTPPSKSALLTTNSSATTAAPLTHSSSNEGKLLTETASPELSRNIIHASNEGFTSSDHNNEIFKVLRIEYTEKAVTRDSKGKATITEKPCVEHVFVPIVLH